MFYQKIIFHKINGVFYPFYGQIDAHAYDNKSFDPISAVSRFKKWYPDQRTEENIERPRPK